jgi:hypothetical protein
LKSSDESTVNFANLYGISKMMKHNFFSACLVALFGLLSLLAICRAQLPDGVTKIEVANGNFENSLEHWETRFGPEKSYSTVLKDGAFEGEAAAQIVLDDGSTPDLRQAAYFARTDFPTDAGYYRLRYAAKTDLHQGEFGAVIGAAGEDDNPLLAIYPGQNGSALLRGNRDGSVRARSLLRARRQSQDAPPGDSIFVRESCGLHDGSGSCHPSRG